MGLFDQFPYTNFHDLNLNWIIGQIKSIKDAAKSTAEDAVSASESAASAAASAGSAGDAAELVNQVRDDLDTVNTEMTNFVQAHSGLSNETVLWSGTASATGDTITLSDDIRNYKYIDVHATYKGAVSSSNLGTFQSNVVRFTPEMFTDENAVLNIPYAYNDQLQICTVFMFWDSTDPTDYTKLSLGYNRRVSINDQGVLTNADNPGTVIVKIVGVKNIADAEVIDARVGEDNTVYPTLKQRLDGEYSDLKSAIAQGGIPLNVKHAMDSLFANIMYINGDMSDEYAIVHAWATSVELVSITAVFNQGSAVIYDTDPLDSLREYLTVTANYSDGSTLTVTDYVLSGELTVGTSTITASYGGKSAVFNVTVTAEPWDFQWNYTQGTPIGNGFATGSTAGTMSANGYVITNSASVLTNPSTEAAKGKTEVVLNVSSDGSADYTNGAIRLDVNKFFAIALFGGKVHYQQTGSWGENQGNYLVECGSYDLNVDNTFTLTWDDANGATLLMNGTQLYSISGALTAQRTRWFLTATSANVTATIKSMKVRAE